MSENNNSENPKVDATPDSSVENEIDIKLENDFAKNLFPLIQKYKQELNMEYFKIMSYDIVLLQEMHVSNPREGESFCRLWKGKKFFSFGGNRSRGVGLLLAKDLVFKLKQIGINGKPLFDRYFTNRKQNVALNEFQSK